MANEAQKEPTMEEILASIRRIISDEDSGKTQPGAPAMRPKQTAAPLSPSDILGDVRQDLEAGISRGASSDEDMFGSDMDDFEDFASEVEFGSIDEIEDKAPAAAAVMEDVPEEAPRGEVDLGRALNRGGTLAEAADDDVLGIDLGDELETEFDEIDDDFAFDGENLSSASPMVSEARWSVEPERSLPEMAAPTALAPEDVGEDEDDEEPEHDQAAAAVSVRKVFVAERETKDMTMANMANRADAGLTDDVAAGAAASAMSKLMGRLDLGGEHTLEGLVREMLKPMLKEWLDVNLPRIVEAKVEEEVQRISRLAR